MEMDLEKRVLLNNDEEMQLEMVKIDGYIIQYISNPSERVQMVAVKQDGCSILYINNPTEKVQLEAVKQDCSSVRYTYNLCAKVKDMVNVIQLKDFKIYVLRLDNGDYRFSIGCQANMNKEELIERIYNDKSFLKTNLQRKKFLNSLAKY